MNANWYYLFTLLFIGYSVNIIAQKSLVDISDFQSNIIIEMPYATQNNFLGEKVYNCEICLLQT
ncbi:MAG: hypothetical protein KAG14_05120, partial [Mycoplasmataceae bacterium]|nr:hypothetical protein [Mycoplasmataceae bacterium]